MTPGGCVWLLQVAAPVAPLQAEAAPGAHLHPGPGSPRYSRGPGSHSCQVYRVIMMVMMTWCHRVKMFPDGGISRIRIMAKPSNLSSEEWGRIDETLLLCTYLDNLIQKWYLFSFALLILLKYYSEPVYVFSTGFSKSDLGPSIHAFSDIGKFLNFN